MLDISFNNLIKEALQLFPASSSPVANVPSDCPNWPLYPHSLPNPFQVSSHAARTCSWATSPSPIYWPDLQFSSVSSSHTNTGASCPASSHWVGKQARWGEVRQAGHRGPPQHKPFKLYRLSNLILLHRHDSFGDSHVRVQRRSHRHRPVPLHPLRTAVPALDLP